jgi:uncharacterized RDD family membrane protein YckC
MYCPYCGNEIREYASICSHCGSPISLPIELTESEIRKLKRQYRQEFGISPVDTVNKAAGELNADVITAMYASRIIAVLIDWVIVIGVVVLVMHSFREKGIDEFLMLLTPIWAFLYFSLTTWVFKGRTVGKAVLGIQVVREDKKSISLVDALLRTIATLISFLFLFAGFIAPVFDAKSKAWHDQFTQTIVIYRR